MSYGISITVGRPFQETLAAVREALIAEGFGVITEIDMAATLKAKLDADVPPQVILGACNPQLAHRALQVEASIGLLLPCNVVVRASAAGRTTVEALDPNVMLAVTGNGELGPIAAQAASRLEAALRSLGPTTTA